MDPATLPPNVVAASFSVRGPLLTRAEEIQRELQDPEKRDRYNFKSVLMCNVGNPQAVVSKQPGAWHYFSFLREVLSLTTSPHLLKNDAVTSQFAPDVVERAKFYHEVVTGGKGIGAYTQSAGYPVVRQRAAKFFDERDARTAKQAGRDGSAIPKVDPSHIFLNNGATVAIRYLLFMLHTAGSRKPCVLMPAPNYVLYNALATLYGCEIAPFELDEANGWSVSLDNVKRAYDQAMRRGLHPVAIEVISPGNPSGTVLSRETTKGILQFALEHDIAVVSDEVYQDLVYDGEFHSTREVLFTEFPEKEAHSVRLASVHSLSKGAGECALRGGSILLDNIHRDVIAQISKLAAIDLSPNSVGQLGFDLMLYPPKPGDASYARHKAEWDNMFNGFKSRAASVSRGLNQCPGITAVPTAAAMYTFPRLRVPSAFASHARSLGRPVDEHWAIELLERYGVLVVPGSGFALLTSACRPQQLYFRSTILPAEPTDMDRFIGAVKSLQEHIIGKYGPIDGEQSKL